MSFRSVVAKLLKGFWVLHASTSVVLTMDALVAAAATPQVVKSPVALVGGGVIARSGERRTNGNDGADDDKDNAA